ncbi:MAG: hypothetical protein KGI75_06665 [Rhizobiaceae bacterium]|nr:hypothetical protein [Rhizobiaceae bacterium]
MLAANSKLKANLIMISPIEELKTYPAPATDFQTEIDMCPDFDNAFQRKEEKSKMKHRRTELVCFVPATRRQAVFLDVFP